jgi:hypothetical protein
MPAVRLWLYSILEFQQGIGNLIRGPMGSILIRDVYTMPKYETLILFISIVFLVSSLSEISY